MNGEELVVLCVGEIEIDAPISADCSKREQKTAFGGKPPENCCALEESR